MGSNNTLSIKFYTRFYVTKVVIIPINGYETNIYVDFYYGANLLYSYLMSNTLTTPELDHNFEVDTIVVKRSGQLSLASVGVLSDCNCEDTSFRIDRIPGTNPLPNWSPVNLIYGGPAKTLVYKFYDSMSK